MSRDKKDRNHMYFELESCIESFWLFEVVFDEELNVTSNCVY